MKKLNLMKQCHLFGKHLKKNRKLIDNELGNSGKENKAYVMFDAEDLDDISQMD